MVTRAQIERLSERVEKIASAGDKQLIVVVDPAETNEQALRRNGLPASVVSRSSYIFVHTGVPRPWRQDPKSRS